MNGALTFSQKSLKTENCHDTNYASFFLSDYCKTKVVNVLEGRYHKW